MGAYFRRVDKGRTACGGFYNGRIDSPRIANRVLSPAEMELAKTRPVEGALATSIVGAWDFSQGIKTTKTTDCSANGLHGSLINLPTRAVTGWNWDASEMNWQNAPEQYGAIHFHEDDVYDARWEVDFSLTCPKRLKSGVYAARLRGEGGGEEYIPFAVRAPGGAPTAKICFCCPPRATCLRQHQHVHQHGGGADSHRPAHGAEREEPAAERASEYGTSLYDSHIDGSGICYSSRLRPVLNFRPKALEWIGGSESTLWQFNADTHLTDWLEAKGFEYDVVTDEDLHYEGLAAIQDYNVVLTGSHPEYTRSRCGMRCTPTSSAAGVSCIWAPTAGTGASPTTPRCRVASRCAAPRTASAPGSRDPASTITASPASTAALAAQRPPAAGHGRYRLQRSGLRYLVLLRAPAGQLQERGLLNLRRHRQGREDRRFRADRRRCRRAGARRVDPLLGTPPNTYVLATSEGHTDLYLVVCEELDVNRPNCDGTQDPLVRADIVFYQTPNGGGRVLHQLDRLVREPRAQRPRQ